MVSSGLRVFSGIDGGDQVNQSRRRLMKSLAASAWSIQTLIMGCNSSKPSAPPIQTTEPPLQIRKNPLRQKLFPLRTAGELLSDLGPLFEAMTPPIVPQRASLGLVYHLLRFWGKEARFLDRMFVNKGLRDNWGSVMTRSLINEDVFHEVIAAQFDQLLVPSEFGLQVRTTSDAGFSQVQASTHPGKYVEVCGMLEIPSDTEISVKNPGRFTLVDVITDEAKRVTFEIELEWLVSGLCRYLLSPSWRNRFRDEISFDEMAKHLMNRKLGRGSCFGAHVPFALATVLQAHSGSALLSQPVIRNIETHLRDLSGLLQKTQQADGSWTSQWPTVSKSKAIDVAPEFSWGNTFADTLTATGHHLEWMTRSPKHLRPPDVVLEGAVEYLVRQIKLVWQLKSLDWHIYLPLSHAAKALLGTLNCEFGTQYKSRPQS